MIISGNTNINKVIYSGYTISKIYACGGSLVWSGDTPSASYRMKIKKIDSTEVISECDGAYSGYPTIYQTEVINIVGGTDIFNSLDQISSIDFGSCPTLSGAAFGVGSYENNSITSVTFSNTSIAHLGTSCLSNLKGLTSVAIPDSITSMDGSVFALSGLRSATIGSGLTELAGSTFYKTPLRTITVPSGITVIGERAFDACDSMTGITIEGSDVELKAGAFRNCTYLRNFDFSNIKKIGGTAFANDTTLSSITIPNTTVQIGDAAFSGCTGIKTAIVQSPITYVSNYTFAKCTSLSSLTLSNTVTTLNEGAFSGCTSLSGFNYPNITVFGANAFNSCTSLASVNLDNAINIGNSAFYNTNLTSVNMPNIETIGNSAFGSISGLTSVTIGEYCRTIGINAFYSVNMPASALTITCMAVVPPTINSTQNLLGRLNAIYVPSGSVEDYKAADGWSRYADYIQAIP